MKIRRSKIRSDNFYDNCDLCTYIFRGELNSPNLDKIIEGKLNLREQTTWRSFTYVISPVAFLDKYEVYIYKSYYKYRRRLSVIEILDLHDS